MQVTLVVNVASNCGYTAANYKGMVSLYDGLKDEGFSVLAFPCNEFGEQVRKTLRTLTRARLARAVCVP